MFYAFLDLLLVGVAVAITLRIIILGFSLLLS